MSPRPERGTDHAAAPRDCGDVVDLLRQQRTLYEELGELSARQRTLIAGDQPEELLKILSERQTLVNALARLNMQLGPFRQHWDEVCDALVPRQRELAGKLVAEINELLSTILRRDSEDGALLSARKQLVADAMRENVGGRAANSAYARQAGRPASRGGADLTG